MSRLAASLASRLPDFVGPTRVIADATSLAACEVDGRSPSAILQPNSAAEIAEILRFASAERLALIPTGGRTHLGIGMPPRHYDLALDLSRMNRILVYEPRDLTLGIEPGGTCADLDRELRQKGQFLPIAPPFGDRATLGGMVAAGMDSPLRYGYGATRDFLLGVEFVTGEGLISKSGGRVVKNVTGYDLHKLFVGSLGTLGIITRLNFRTFPLPPRRQMFVIAFDGPSLAFEFCRSLVKSPLDPKVLEILDRGTAALFQARGVDFLPSGSWIVAVEAAGHESVLARHERDLASISREARAAGFVSLQESQRERLFACLSEFPPIALAANRTAVIFRVSILPSAMPSLLEEIRSLADDHGLTCAILIRALGVVYVALLSPEQSPERSLTGATITLVEPPLEANTRSPLINCSRSMVDLFISQSALPTIERCPLDVKTALDVWPPPGTENEIAQRLKRVFDPREILSPGRFRGGI
jgi:glycolate oxidase FAD binding subunit